MHWCSSCLQRLTIVEVTKVSGIEEEVCSEEVTEAPSAWSEGQRRVEVEASSPVGLSSQVVTCHTSNTSKQPFQLTIKLQFHCQATQPHKCLTFTLWAHTVHTESPDTGGASKIEPRRLTKTHSTYKTQYNHEPSDWVNYVFYVTLSGV